MLGTFYFTPPGREDISIVSNAIMVGRFSAYFDIKEAEVKIESSQKFKFQKVKDPPNFPARATLNPHILGYSRMKEGACPLTSPRPGPDISIRDKTNISNVGMELTRTSRLSRHQWMESTPVSQKNNKSDELNQISE